MIKVVFIELSTLMYLNFLFFFVIKICLYLIRPILYFCYSARTLLYLNFLFFFVMKICLYIIRPILYFCYSARRSTTSRFKNLPDPKRKLGEVEPRDGEAGGRVGTPLGVMKKNLNLQNLIAKQEYKILLFIISN